MHHVIEYNYVDVNYNSIQTFIYVIVTTMWRTVGTVRLFFRIKTITQKNVFTRGNLTGWKVNID